MGTFGSLAIPQHESDWGDPRSDFFERTEEMNAYINTPVALALDTPLVFQGLNSASKGCWLCNGGWLLALQNAGTFKLNKPGRYLVTFSAQVTAAAAGPVALAINSNGVQIPGTAMAETLTAADDLAQLSTTTEVTVTPCDVQTITIENTGATDITVNAASLVIFRLA